MTKLTYKNVHHKFKLNGLHLDREDLCRVGHNFIKEGSPFEKPVGSFILDWFDEKSYLTGGLCRGAKTKTTRERHGQLAHPRAPKLE